MMLMLPALTMMVAMTVNVTLATLEMAFHVQVSYSLVLCCNLLRIHDSKL